MKTYGVIFALLIAVVCVMVFSDLKNESEKATANASNYRSFIDLTSNDPNQFTDGLEGVRANWHPGSATMLLEVAKLTKTKQTYDALLGLLERKTGQNFDKDLPKWREWIWNQKYDPHPEYIEFKKAFYKQLDPSFPEYFEVADNAKVRLDEIVWGGVGRDGIPPLKNPVMISAETADYLADSDVVFGIDLNEDPRCYPKRILAWHEMFKDTIGGESVCGVY